MTSIRGALGLLGGLAFAAACAPVEEGQEFDRGESIPVAGGPTEIVPRSDYPAPPYGVLPGDVISNYQFLGWSRPMDANFDTNAFQTLSFADSYDPDGSKGVRALVVTAGAVWCTVCQYEYEQFSSGILADYEARGVSFLGTLFQDEGSGPAQPKHLSAWAKRYDVNFPFVLDPALQLGGYFDVQATPMSMVIDTRTMTIHSVIVGWSDSELWDTLDSMLAE